MIGFILNIPYTFIGLLLALVSGPTAVSFRTNPYAFIFHIKKFWWAIGYMKNARAMAMGHVVMLSPNVEDKDLEHELVHVEQHQQMPIIQPILYYIELLRKGYRNNKYEIEAYNRAGNVYRGLEYVEVSIRITLPSEISAVIEKEKERFVEEYGSSYKSEPHLTLYLARYTEDGLSKLIEDLKQLTFSPFIFSLSEPKVNPEGYRNLYVMDVSNKDQIHELHNQVSEIASRYQSSLPREKDQKRIEQGISVAPKPWFPHITLGEVPIDAPQPELEGIRSRLASIEGKEIIISNFTVFLYGKNETEEKMRKIKEVTIELN